MYARILKANPYHDSKGRFTSKDKVSTSTEDGIPFTSTGSPSLDGLVARGSVSPKDPLQNAFSGEVRWAYFKERGFGKEEAEKYMGMLEQHTKDHGQEKADADIQDAVDGKNPRYLEFLVARADAEESLMRAADEVMPQRVANAKEKERQEFMRDVGKPWSQYSPEYDGPDPGEYWERRFGQGLSYTERDLYSNQSVYRRGSSGKTVLSTSSSSEGANTSIYGSGALIEPTHSWKVKDLQKEGYRVVAGVTGLYGYVGEAEVLFIKLPKTIKKYAQILKANPYKDKNGRFTSKDKAVTMKDPVQAVMAWTAKGGPLASKHPLTTKLQKELDSWLDSSPLVDSPLERGIAMSRASWDATWKSWTTPGEVIEMPGRASFTKDVGSGRAMGYKGGDVAIKLKTVGPTKGRDLKGLGVYDVEQEVLVPRGTKFVVKNWDTTPAGIHVITVQYLPPKK